MDKFGAVMSSIIKDVLQKWFKAMRVKLRDTPEFRPINEKGQVDLIMDYLRDFENKYESEFGKLEETVAKPDEAKNHTVYIRSTAHGTKVFLALLMADRLNVIDEKRRKQRERICFVELSASDLEEDSKNCPICNDVMGFQSAEGKNESPVKLVACCGQILGNTWFVRSLILRS